MYWIGILVSWNILWCIMYKVYNVEFSWRILAIPFLLYAVFHVLDAHSTYLCIQKNGAAGETNLSIVFLARLFNTELFTIVIASKIIIIFILLPVLITFFQFRYAYATLLSSNLAFAFIVSSNYYTYYKMAHH
ncbi:MAG: hypothetical protein HYZ69_03075 [Candidatus Colwellbacteria bacterium]|nr:hypothetical protein [Candidatus Colwellbacteria bacterium]